jgi:hypothetical protein
LDNFKWDSGLYCGAEKVNLCNDNQCSGPLESSFITAEFYEVSADPLTGDIDMKINVDLS